MQLSLVTVCSHIAVQPHLGLQRSECAGVTSLFFECNAWTRARIFKKGSVLTPRSGFKLKRNLDESWRCRCDMSDDGFDLELEILDFMMKSEKPAMFPTKEELIKAGRMDLVEAIKTADGWYALGWDEENEAHDDDEAMNLDFEDSVRSVKSSNGNVSSYKNSSRGDLNFRHLTTPTALDAPLVKETCADENANISDMLSRLKKLSSNDFAIILQNAIFESRAKRKDDLKDRPFDASLGVARCELGENGSVTADFHHNGALNTSNGKSSPDIKPESWRTWSNKRAGFHYKDFEAAEITYSRNREESHRDEMITTEEYAEDGANHKVLDYNEIKDRILNLESDLTSALHSFRSQRVPANSSALLDAWELQENEFISAQWRLSSIKAMAKILEGKMLLAAIDKEEKVGAKLRHNGNSRAMQLLRTSCIVWPFPASEVLLAGSFDGWTTQRKMERSESGMFSLCLMLYTGRYEMKFIVDGVWKVDLLRPIVASSGYENNLFVVT